MTSGRWVVERTVWRPRLRRWDTSYYQDKVGVALMGGYDGAWHPLVRFATKLDEATARRYAASRSAFARAVPLVVVLGRPGSTR